MLTKQEYCQHVIETFCKENGLRPSELNDSHVLSSSNLGIAMEFLGLIQDEEMKLYIQGRGGVHISTISGGILSARDLLSLLPE